MASTRQADTGHASWVADLAIVLTWLPIPVHLPPVAPISQHGVDAAPCLSKYLLDQNDSFNGQCVEPRKFLRVGRRR